MGARRGLATRATSSRNGGRVHLGNSGRLQIGKVGEIISECWATSSGIRTKSLSAYIIKIARLGGYLARANDPAPGNLVMWRGLSRLTDIELGAHLAPEIVGN